MPLTTPPTSESDDGLDAPALWWTSDGEDREGAWPLVAVQGLGYTADMWFRLVPALSRTRRLVRFDNRGVGRSSLPAPPWELTDLADDVLRVMDAAGCERAHVAGVSMGGLVAQEVALRAPDRVVGLVLGATHPGGREALRMDPAAATMLMDRSSRSAREVAESSVPFLYAAATERSDIDADLAVRLRHRLRATAYWGQLDAMRRHPGTLGRLGAVQAPTLVLVGAEDRLVQPGNSALLTAALPDARQVTLDDAGHVFWTDRTEAAADAVTQFLAEVDGRIRRPVALG